jgi:hypothetical protein
VSDVDRWLPARRVATSLCAMAAEELCLPASAPTPAFSDFRNADPLSWSQMDCLCPRNAHRSGCAGAPGTALAAAGSGESAGIGLFYGRAQATDSAEAAAEAAADALAKLEVDRAMGSYGRFDSSSGLVVATAGRSAPALAALLASTERGTLRKIVVANCSAGAKMAQALTFGLQRSTRRGVPLLGAATALPALGTEPLAVAVLPALGMEPLAAPMAGPAQRVMTAPRVVMRSLRLRLRLRRTGKTGKRFRPTSTMRCPSRQRLRRCASRAQTRCWRG